MNQLFVPLGMRIIIGAWLSIILGIIMTSIAVGFEFMTLKNINQSLSSSILDGSITLLVGYLVYLFVRSVVGKHSAEFILETFPYVTNKIEEKLSNDVITEDEATKLLTSLYRHANTISALDGFALIIQLSYLLIILIFMGVSFVAYYKPMDIDVGKFAIFEVVTMIGLYVAILIYMHTVDKKIYELV